MSLALILAIASAVMLCLFLVGVPVVLCIASWLCLVAFFANDTQILANIGEASFSSLNSFALLAMPLFILTGDIMLESGLAKNVAGFARALLWRVRGASGVTAVAAGGIFAAISGSNAATAAMLTKLTNRDMIEEGYRPEWAAATAACAGTVGIIIPPSIMFIVYGVLISVPIGDLFVAGIVPGILMCATMMLITFLIARKTGIRPGTPTAKRELLLAARRSKHALLVIVLGLGGIYLGVYSPTEAAAVAVAYLIITALFERRMSLGAVPRAMTASAATNGVLAPLIAFSIVLQQVFSIVGVPSAIESALLGVEIEWVALALMLAIIFISGAVLESLPNVVIWAPIMAPVAAVLGIDPVHFGVMFMVGIAIGFVTPPYGLNLFVVSDLTGLPYTSVAKTSLAYLGGLLTVWVVVVATPALSTWLPNLVEG
jgi:C4-dicarboxylate transporter DctM subunit